MAAVLLAEELALVALNPESGCHAVGTRGQLNACFAALLVADLLHTGLAEPAGYDGVTAASRRAPSSSSILDSAADVVAESGPSIATILSSMDRGLARRLGTGTWDAVMSGLLRDGVVTGRDRPRLPRYELVDVGVRDGIVQRLRTAAATDEPLEPRTALLLAMTWPARLLEVVAPERRSRRHARDRIDQALNGSEADPLGNVYRRLVADATVAAAAISVVP
jgi:hypothetical protein